jgi:hypothetical protein
MANIYVHAQNKSEETRYVQADYMLDYENAESIEDLFDYCFEGTVLTEIGVSQYNGEGTNIPYTYFLVRVDREIKGMVNKVVKIKFYGGYDEENVLYLLENTEMPVEGETYIFYCNQTTKSFEGDGRTLDGSFVISNPYSIVQHNDVVLRFGDGIGFEPPGGGGATPPSDPKPDNDSFSKATSVSINTNYTISLSNGYSQYFKIKRSALDYLCVYSTGSLDVRVYVYDSSYNLVGSNDDVNGRGTQFTSGTNFFHNFYAEKNKYYYIKINTYNSYVSGSTTFRLQVDNYYVSNYSNLVYDGDCVNLSNKIYYTNYSSYTTEVGLGAAEWNKLGSVQILPDTSSTLNTLNIYDFYDPDSLILATTINNWILAWKVQYNTYYFSTMTQKERLKTIIHEFGHCMGFSEFAGQNYSESEDNVMVQGLRPFNKLGPADIAVYKQKWG